MFFFLFASGQLFSGEGKIINPITDVCWECLFPITVSGVNVTPGQKDFTESSQLFCFCAGLPPKAGVPLTFWEPAKVVDVTRHAYCLMALGGLKISEESIKNRGSVGTIGEEVTNMNSFYHVHWYHFPILKFLELFADLQCTEKTDLDIGYMSEFDPFWNNDQWSFIMNAESALFSSPIAQLACIPDCLAANINKPIDKLFWCAGCDGSLYPFTGNIAHHEGGLQASSLLVYRMIAKLHRQGLLNGYRDNEFCNESYMPIIKKSMYKLQLVYPVAQESGPCQALGRSNLIWGVGKSYPYKGEDFVYLVWIKKHCCIDAAGAAVKTLAK